MRDSIICLHSSFEELVHKWISPLGFGYDINAAQVVSRHDRVYYGTMRGVLYCLDYRTGELLWSKMISRVTLNSVLPLDRGGIVVTDFDGNVWRIDG
jgi:outer membrane protein assembly factor BamB